MQGDVLVSRSVGMESAVDVALRLKRLAKGADPRSSAMVENPMSSAPTVTVKTLMCRMPINC
jgi:hypothetical protein